MYNACADNSWPQQIVLNKHATVHACITILFGRSSCLTAQIKVLSQSFFSFCYRAAILTGRWRIRRSGSSRTRLWGLGLGWRHLCGQEQQQDSALRTWGGVATPLRVGEQQQDSALGPWAGVATPLQLQEWQWHSAVGERQRLVAWVEVPTQPLWVTLPLEFWWPWLHFLPWNALHSRE